MKKKILSIAKYIFFLALGACLFWLAIKDAPFDQIVAEFKKVNYSWIIFTIFIMLLSHLVRAIRWNQLITNLGKKPTTISTMYAVLIGYFVNLAVPRLGEVTRCGVLAKHNKLPVNSVIGTVIAERAFDMICLVVIIIITFLLQISFLGGVINDMVSKVTNNGHLLIIIAFALAVIILFIVLAIKFYKEKLRKYKIYRSAENLVKGFWEGVKTIKYVNNKKLFVANTIIIWMLYTSTLYFSFFAFEGTRHLTFLDALTIMMMGSIGVVAPTPGGMGTYQATVQYSLIFLGMINMPTKEAIAATAFSFAFIVYFTQWIMTILFGGIAWILLFLATKKQNNNEQN